MQSLASIHYSITTVHCVCTQRGSRHQVVGHKPRHMLATTTPTGIGLPREAHCFCKGAQAFSVPCDGITAVPCATSKMAAGLCPSIPPVMPCLWSCQGGDCTTCGAAAHGSATVQPHTCTRHHFIPLANKIHPVGKRDQQKSLQVLQHCLA